MSEGIPYKQILHEHDKFHSKKTAKSKALHKAPERKLKTVAEKHFGATEKEMHDYQRRVGRAYND